MEELVTSFGQHSHTSGFGLFEFVLNDSRLGAFFDSTDIDPSTWNYPVDSPIVIAFNGNKRKSHYLGTGLKFLWAGDLNRDGTSEVIFWVDRYNQNGYALYDQSLNELATHTWTYH
ncbi:MAG: hypothetical protein AMXMBFR84_36280 [Candidatus Hydrogenedentota bacterium]